jgi:hypothetical protein
MQAGAALGDITVSILTSFSGNGGAKFSKKRAETRTPGNAM